MNLRLGRASPRAIPSLHERHEHAKCERNDENGVAHHPLPCDEGDDAADHADRNVQPGNNEIRVHSLSCVSGKRSVGPCASGADPSEGDLRGALIVRSPTFESSAKTASVPLTLDAQASGAVAGIPPGALHRLLSDVSLEDPIMAIMAPRWPTSAGVDRGSLAAVHVL